MIQNCSLHIESIRIYTKIQEVVKTQNKHKEIDSKKTSKQEQTAKDR